MEDFEKTIIQHSEQIKTLFNRTEQLEKIVESVNNLTLSVKELAIGQRNMGNDIATLQSDVELVKSKPAKRWEEMTGKVIWAVIAAALGVILGKFGM